MASQKQARDASRPAKSGADAARPGSASPKRANRTAQNRAAQNRAAQNRAAQNRAAPASTVRAGQPGQAGAGQAGREPDGRGPAGRGANGRGPAGRGANGRGQDSRGQNGRAPRAQPRSGSVTAEPLAGGAVARIAPRWFQLTTLVLSLAGLGVSIYLTVVHYGSSNILICSDKGTINCEKVITSPESMVFGVFPVAVLGLAFYVFLVAINSPWAWRSRLPAVWWARVGGIVTGMGFVLYLLYAEIIQIGNICLWCTSVHVITFLLFVLLVFYATLGTGITARDAR
jgi:uncharacterized membrane protein